MIDQNLNAQRTCATCTHAHQEQMQGQIMRQLVCHESPPNSCMITAPGPGGQMGVQGVTMFPVVQPHMFCSRWKSATLHLPVKAPEGATDTDK